METILAPASRGVLSFAASYSALLIVLGFVLTLLVIRRRRAQLIGIGDGGDKTLARLIRVHGNFTENTPFLLAILILLPFLGAREWMVHLVGLAGLSGRILHAIGLSQSVGKSWGRVLGMVLTQNALLIGAGCLLYLAWR